MSIKQRGYYKIYSPELKFDAVQGVLAGESVRIVAKQLEVTDSDYIYNWIKKHLQILHREGKKSSSK